MEIWRFKDNGVTTLTLTRKKGRGRIRERRGKGKGDGKRKVKRRELKKSWTHGRTHRRTDTRVILFSVQCYALH